MQVNEDIFLYKMKKLSKIKMQRTVNKRVAFL